MPALPARVVSVAFVGAGEAEGSSVLTGEVKKPLLSQRRRHCSSSSFIISMTLAIKKSNVSERWTKSR
jgi:hypothetical protein